MHRLTPAEAAARGWSHGRFKDGYCLMLICEAAPDDLAEFIANAAKFGEEYVDLRKLREVK